jgi:hypothetical protein
MSAKFNIMTSGLKRDSINPFGTTSYGRENFGSFPKSYRGYDRDIVVKSRSKKDNKKNNSVINKKTTRSNLFPVYICIFLFVIVTFVIASGRIRNN